MKACEKAADKMFHLINRDIAKQQYAKLIKIWEQAKGNKARKAAWENVVEMWEDLRGHEKEILQKFGVECQKTKLP